MSLHIKSRKYASSTFRPRDVPATCVVTTPYRRPTVRPPSLHGGVDTAAAPAKPSPAYTGTEMLGVGTMHKSNAVPVFNADAAKDLATMRRS